MIIKFVLLFMLAAAAAVAVYYACLGIYKLYRVVRRENDLDRAELEAATAELQRESEKLQETLDNVRKNRNA